jgi:hypothetical protein
LGAELRQGRKLTTTLIVFASGNDPGNARSFRSQLMQAPKLLSPKLQSSNRDEANTLATWSVESSRAGMTVGENKVRGQRIFCRAQGPDVQIVHRGNAGAGRQIAAHRDM